MWRTQGPGRILDESYSTAAASPHRGSADVALEIPEAALGSPPCGLTLMAWTLHIVQKEVYFLPSAAGTGFRALRVTAPRVGNSKGQATKRGW